MFTICGARGDLSTTLEGPCVDYDRTEIANADNRYYYRPSGRLSFYLRLLFITVSASLENYSFIDHKGLNDRLTSTEQTSRRGGFRSDVMQRDGPYCVVTQVEEEFCDAAHLIKGVEVRFVFSSYGYWMALFSSTFCE
jgi:hypothetical protein